MTNSDIQELFVCDCGDPSHQFIISADAESSDDHYVYVSVHLNRDHNIFKRMWTALKYIFGRRSIFGDFDEVIINPKDADRLQKVVDFLKKHQE
jgi:hypothetical protein